MEDCCATCKFEEYRGNYVYPYRCLKDKGTRYSADEWLTRILNAYKCKEFLPTWVKESEKDG